MTDGRKDGRTYKQTFLINLYITLCIKKYKQQLLHNNKIKNNKNICR